MSVRESISRGSYYYIVKFCKVNKTGIIFSEVVYSSLGDGIKSESNEMQPLAVYNGVISEEEARRRAINEGFPTQVPEQIDMQATITSFISQFENEDFNSHPRLIGLK